MDDVDRQLIALLRDNARLSVVALAQKLRLARATVQNRIARLEKAGVIVGYTLRLKPVTEAHRIRAIMGIEIDGHHGDEVRGNPAVEALHSTNGRWDLMAELRADSLDAFDKVLNTIRSIKGIRNTETSILLSTHKL
jgi:DNA-binding Lrp family transcriptional regulator